MASSETVRSPNVNCHLQAQAIIRNNHEIREEVNNN